MLRLFRLVLVAVVMAGVMLTPPAEAADPPTQVDVTWTGSGTINPGLSVDPKPQVWFSTSTVTATGVYEGRPVVLEPSLCQDNLLSLVAEAIPGGAGAGQWNCNDGLFDGEYGHRRVVRAGGDYDVVMTGSMAGTLHCLFQPDQTPPATVVSYRFACAGTLTSGMGIDP